MLAVRIKVKIFRVKHHTQSYGFTDFTVRKNADISDSKRFTWQAKRAQAALSQLCGYRSSKVGIS